MNLRAAMEGRCGMRTILVLAAATLAGSCAATDPSLPPEPGAIRVAGHPYWTMPDCRRDQPLGRWDNACDVPRLGLPRGIANSDFDIGGPVVAGSGAIGF
jgi:hypothetical protein